MEEKCLLKGEFIKLCKKLLSEAGTETKDTFSKLGISFSSYNEGKEIGQMYNTDSDEYRALTQETFVNLFKRGLIYEDSRITNWDPKLRIARAASIYRD